MARDMCLDISMQHEESFKNTNASCHMLTWYVYILVCKEGDIKRIPMSSFMCLKFSMQEEDITEHTNANGHVFTFLVNLLIIV
jgi:hypothetical protein